MDALLQKVLKERKLLIGVAAPVEGLAVCRALGMPESLPERWERHRLVPGIDLLHLGVGKASASAALAYSLDMRTDGAVLNVGIAGSLPTSGKKEFILRPSQTIAASSCVFGDEGIVTDSGYQDVAAMGFPMTNSGRADIACHVDLVRVFSAHVDRVGAIATVSTCSGTDGLSQEIARRTGALAETMEGAACALVCEKLGVAFCEVRAISNLTGARASQQWDIAGALRALGVVLGRVLT